MRSVTDQPLSRKSASGINVLKYMSGFSDSVCGGERGRGWLWLWRFFCVYLALLSFFFKDYRGKSKSPVLEL